MKLSRSTILSSLSQISFNLTSIWLGVLIVTPGFSEAGFAVYLDLLLKNLPPAIMSTVVGMIFLERSKK
ncbi:hypothetical protein HY384_04445 [Candidatus Daviesbacteria bacterium]|nr:hypothetical protein [Candidatus Daviesbacteria bacterium]